MTDRELLEAAAKAAGIEVRWHENWQCFVRVKPFNTDNPPTGAGERLVWLPLHDDGDALRLAVELNIHITISEFHRTVCHQGDYFRSIVEHGTDKRAATRRAIVEAAAAIVAEDLA